MWNAVRLPRAGGAVFLSASVTASGPAMQNPLTGFLFPMGNKGGFCRGASEREGGPKTEAAK